MGKKRFEHIDFLRAVAIIGVIAIHTLSYNLNNQIHYLLWNYLNFVVVSFIFCSGYVLTYLYKDRFTTELHVFDWYKKRLSKLIIPFYIYLAVHYALWFIFPHFFAGLGLQKSWSFLWKSLLLIGGVDLNWLALLFIQLTLVFPFLIHSLKRKKVMYLYGSIALITAIIFTFLRFPHEYYRSVMWLSWSVILLLSMGIYVKEKSDTNSAQTIKRYITGMVICGVLFSLLVVFHMKTDRSFQLVDYKYPPGFYYMLYGQMITFLILIIGEAYINSISIVKTWSLYISKHSYQLYFIHFIVLDFIIKTTKNSYIGSQPLIQFVFVLAISLTTCVTLNILLKTYKKQPLVKEAA